MGIRAALVAFLLLVSGGQAIGADKPPVPQSVMRCRIVAASRAPFVEALTRFAKENAFEMQSSPMAGMKDSVQIQLLRKDIKILALNPTSVEQFRIQLYRNSDNIPLEAARKMAERLKAALRGVSAFQFDKECHAAT